MLVVTLRYSTRRNALLGPKPHSREGRRFQTRKKVGELEESRTFAAPPKIVPKTNQFVLGTHDR